MGNALRRLWGTGNADTDQAWKRRNQEVRNSVLYRHVSINKRGRLIAVYQEEGPAAAEKYLIREIEPLLYDGGRGRLITKQDYLRYRNELEAQARGVEYDKSDGEVYVDLRDLEVNFEEHEACWRLDKRGAFGETLLHLLIVNDDPICRHLIEILLNLYPNLAKDIYEGTEYYGESALHLAIVQGNTALVKKLIENGAKVNQRATGKFFLPEDQRKSRPTKKTNYEGYAYYGEYPLAFAGCFGREEIYDYLLSQGADPDLKDQFGNTVLHLCVIADQLTMFGYAVKNPFKKAKMDAMNNRRLTPLMLASILGRHTIFKEIIELNSIEIWRYSNVTCANYNLTALETIRPDGKLNKDSALIYVTDGDTDQHLEILNGGVIQQLLDEKWKTFARKKFIEKFVITMLFLLTFSFAIYLRPDRNTGDGWGSTTLDYVRYFAEICVILYCLYVGGTMIGEIYSQGYRVFLKDQSNAPAKSVHNVSCVLILGCVPLRFVRDYQTETILLAIAAPAAWSMLLFFARVSNQFGPFVIMIYKMTASDMVRFFIIFMVFLIQFSQGFFFLFKDIDDPNVTVYKTPLSTLMQLCQMTFGEFKYENFDQTRLPMLTKILFLLFAILVPILLLNMLIAMMGNTYQQVISRSEDEWKRQWAKIIMVLERSYRPAQLVRFMNEYSVPMRGSEARGIMVIKISVKSKARQRKGAIQNWKKLVYEVKALLMHQKLSGKFQPEDLTSEALFRRKNARNEAVSVPPVQKTVHVAPNDNATEATKATKPQKKVPTKTSPRLSPSNTARSGRNDDSESLDVASSDNVPLLKSGGRPTPSSSAGSGHSTGAASKPNNNGKGKNKVAPHEPNKATRSKTDVGLAKKTNSNSRQSSGSSSSSLLSTWDDKKSKKSDKG